MNTDESMALSECGVEIVPVFLNNSFSYEGNTRYLTHRSLTCLCICAETLGAFIEIIYVNNPQ